MTQEAGYFCQRNRTPFDLIKPGYQKNKTALTAQKDITNHNERPN